MEETILKDMKDELICSICHQVYTDPVGIPSCCHMFCRSCIEPILEQTQNCPKCLTHPVYVKDLRTEKWMATVVKLVHELELEVESGILKHTYSEYTHGSDGGTSEVSKELNDEESAQTNSLLLRYPADHLPTVLLQKHMERQLEEGLNNVIIPPEFTESTASDSHDARRAVASDDEDYVDGSNRRKRAAGGRDSVDTRGRKRVKKGPVTPESPVVDRKLKRKVSLKDLVKSNLVAEGGELEFRGCKGTVTAEGKIIYNAGTEQMKQFKSLSSFANYLFQSMSEKNSKTMYDGWIAVTYNGIKMDYFRAMYVATIGVDNIDDGYKRDGHEDDDEDILNDEIISLYSLSDDDVFQSNAADGRPRISNENEAIDDTAKSFAYEQVIDNTAPALGGDEVITIMETQEMPHGRFADENLIPSSLPQSSQPPQQFSQRPETPEFKKRIQNNSSTPYEVAETPVVGSKSYSPFKLIQRAFESSMSPFRPVEATASANEEEEARQEGQYQLVEFQKGDDEKWDLSNEDVYVVSPTQSSPPTPQPSRKIYNKKVMNTLFSRFVDSDEEEEEEDKMEAIPIESNSQAQEKAKSMERMKKMASLSKPVTLNTTMSSTVSQRLPIFNPVARPQSGTRNVKGDMAKDGSAKPKDKSDSQEKPKKKQSTLMRFGNLFSKLDDILNPSR